MEVCVNASLQKLLYLNTCINGSSIEMMLLIYINWLLVSHLNLLHSERPKLHRVLAVLSGIGLKAL